MAFDDTVDMARMARYADGVLRDRVLRQVHALPDRLDTRGTELLDRIMKGVRRDENLHLLEELCETMLQRVAVRPGRHDPISGTKCAEALS